jgi:hypothetical protein
LDRSTIESFQLRALKNGIDRALVNPLPSRSHRPQSGMGDLPALIFRAQPGVTSQKNLKKANRINARKRTSRHAQPMSAFGGKADIPSTYLDVRF